MKSRGFALMAVLVIVILVPIVVFGITFFITSSITRYETQTRSLKALYLAQSGIQRDIFNLRSTNGGSAFPLTRVYDLDANNRINLVQVAPTTPPGCGIFQLCSTGTSVSSTYPTQISRKVFAQYELATNKVQMYLESDGTGIPPPLNLIGGWDMTKNSDGTTGSGFFKAALLAEQSQDTYNWVTGPDGTPNSAIQFNASGHTLAQITDPAALDALSLTTDGILEVQVRVDATIPSNGTVIHKGNDSANKYEAYSITVNNGIFGLLLRDAAGGTHTLSSGFLAVVGTWYNVRVAWNASGMRIYVSQYGSPSVLRNSNTTAVTVRQTDSTDHRSALNFGTDVDGNSGQKTPVSIGDVKIATDC